MKVLWFRILVILLIYSSVYAQKPVRVEPPFWWTDMKHSDLQILLYGKDIARYQVQIQKAKLIKTIRTAHPDYLFVYVDTHGLPAGFFEIDLLKNNWIKQKIPYELKQRTNRKPLGFDSSDVIYLLMPDRFSNGNSENDNHPEMLEKVNRKFDGGRHGGDIQGIVNHLDYLQDLGITTLWSTPLLEDNEPAYSYHGYAISDLYRIDPRYGSNDDYQRLADELHRRKMKLIMDYVINHWGSKHWLIQNLPDTNWIHFWQSGNKGFKRSNYRMTTQFDPHATQKDKIGSENGWFDTTMPDMNLSNPELLQYTIQNAIWWIEYAGLDGLRVDTYSYNDKEAISKWTQAITDEYPSINIVGEVWMHNQAQIAYWQKESPVGAIQNYNSHLPTLMDFTLHDAIKVMFDEDIQSWNKGMQRAYDNFTNDFLYANPDNLLVFMGNHDTNRINEIYKGDFDKYKLAFTLIATVRGIPQLYYGDEIGMQGDKEQNGDGDIRRDFPGGWQNDGNNAFSQNGRTVIQQKYFEFTRKLLQWRQKNKAVQYGIFKHFLPKNNVYVYFRIYKDDKVMVVINNSNRSRSINWKDYKELLQNAVQGKNILTEQAIFFDKNYVIKPKTVMIVEVEEGVASAE